VQNVDYPTSCKQSAQNFNNQQMVVESSLKAHVGAYIGQFVAFYK